MKIFFRQLFFLVLYFFVLYFIGFGFSYILFSDKQREYAIDTYESHNKIYFNPYRNILLGLPKLAFSDKAKILLLGSSDLLYGFRPRELNEVFPDYEIHNFGMHSSNLTETKQLVDLIVKVLPKENLKKSVFVLGLFYSILVEDSVHYWETAGKTNLVFTFEASSPCLYKMSGKDIVPNMQIKYMPYVVALLRPCLMFQIILDKAAVFINSSRSFLHLLIREQKFNFLVFFHHLNYMCVDEDYKKDALVFWEDFMGSKNGILADEQFEVLVSLSKVVSASGAKLIIADLPVPAWHRQRSAYFLSFQKKKTNYLNQCLNLPNVKYIDMQQSMLDADFLDSAHPVPEVTRKWSECLKGAL
jgi:hypothetical protein